MKNCLLVNDNNLSHFHPISHHFQVMADYYGPIFAMSTRANR